LRGESDVQKGYDMTADSEGGKNDEKMKKENSESRLFVAF